MTYIFRDKKNIFFSFRKPYFLFFLFTLAQSEGAIKIAGSSTLYPLQEAISEEFKKKNPNIRISISVSGTGGGVQKFIKKEADIVGASRSMTDDELKKAPEHEKIFVAFDGVTLIVNKKNHLKNLSMSQLKLIWNINSQIFFWDQIQKEFQHKKVRFYGPDPDSGTFDFFTQKVNGKTKFIRKDFTPSDHDQMLVKALIQDELGLGYLGYSYYREHKEKLTAVSIDGIDPNDQTISSGIYPLQRPLYIYVRKDSLRKNHINEFINFYKDQVQYLSQEVGLVPKGFKR